MLEEWKEEILEYWNYGIMELWNDGRMGRRRQNAGDRRQNIKKTTIQKTEDPSEIALPGISPRWNSTAKAFHWAGGAGRRQPAPSGCGRGRQAKEIKVWRLVAPSAIP